MLPHQWGGFADPDPARTYTVQVPIPRKDAPEQSNNEEADSPNQQQMNSSDNKLAEGQQQQNGDSNGTIQQQQTETKEIEIPGFDHVNLYTDNVDLPQIKPRTINNRNEFYVAIPVPTQHANNGMDQLGLPSGVLVNGMGELSREEAKRAIGNSVIRDYEQRNLATLR